MRRANPTATPFDVERLHEIIEGSLEDPTSVFCISTTLLLIVLPFYVGWGKLPKTLGLSLMGIGGPITVAITGSSSMGVWWLGAISACVLFAIFDDTVVKNLRRKARRRAKNRQMSNPQVEPSVVEAAAWGDAPVDRCPACGHGSFSQTEDVGVEVLCPHCGESVVMDRRWGTPARAAAS